MGAHEIKDIVAWNRQNVSNYAEAVAQRCSVKKVFLKIFQNSQESTCARVSFLINKLY